MKNLFLETERLAIYHPEETDIDKLCVLLSDSEVVKYMGHGQPRTHKEVQEGLMKAISHRQKYGFSMGLVYEKTTQQFIGRAGLFHLSFDDTQTEIEISYALLPIYWQKGYATELARALVAWGFKHLLVSRLVGIIYPDNHASKHVLEKIGMSYVDDVVYAAWSQPASFYAIEK